MLRPATDCFAAAGRLQSAWFRANDPDLNNAVLVSIDNWVDAGSKDLYIYDKCARTRPSRHGPSLLGPFVTILDASEDAKCQTVLHSL